MKGSFVKTLGGLMPYDEESELWYGSLSIGQIVSGEFKKTRNYMFLKKYMALINIAYDHWKPQEIEIELGGKIVTPAKNKKRFRKDLTILAGYFHTVFRLDGSYRVEADSISFANMSEEDFTKLFQATITVLIDKIYGSGYDTKRIENMVNECLSFS